MVIVLAGAKDAKHAARAPGVLAAAAALLAGGAAIAAPGCGGSDDGGGGGAGDPVLAGAQPPAKGGAPTQDASERNFALKTMDFGESERWKKLGYNIDGKISTSASVDVCKPTASGDRSVHNNGDSGIDNSFGQKIVPFLGQLAPITTSVTQAIADGAFTVMIDVTGLTDDAKQTATGASGKIFAGGAFDPDDAGLRPTFTTSDDWPVRPELLSSPSDAKSSTIAFHDAYVSGGTWVNGSGSSDVRLSLTLAGSTLSITVHHAIITFNHTAPGHAANGVVAGVIGTQELVASVGQVAGSLNSSLCDPVTAASLAKTLEGASDILSDGTQDPAKTCDGISIGLGFTAEQIAPPSKVAPPAAAAAAACAAPAADAGPPDAADGGR